MIPIVWLFLAFVAPIHSAFKTSHPVSALRGLVPMLMGGVIFYITEYLKKIKISQAKTILLTILEFFLYFLMAFVAFRNYSPSSIIIVIAFFAILITLSGHSLTSKIRCKFFNFLGGISLPLFMWHFGIIHIIKRYQWMGMTKRYLIIFGGSIIISAIHYIIVQKIISKQNKKRAKIKA